MKLIIIVLLVYWVYLTVGIPVRLHRIECHHNPTVCLKGKCNITTIRNRITLLNFGCFFEEPQSNVSVHLVLSKKSSGKYSKWVVDATESLCSAIEKTSKSSLLARVLPTVSQFAAGSGHCPLKGNVYLVNSPLDLRFIPALLPPGEYRLGTTLKNLQQELTQADLFFRIG